MDRISEASDQHHDKADGGRRQRLLLPCWQVLVRVEKKANRDGKNEKTDIDRIVIHSASQSPKRNLF